MNRIFRSALRTAPLILLLAITACHSYHIELTLQNKTGGPISLLEVDYPSASFGADALASNATFHYRIQVRGSSPIKIQYTAANGHQVQITGPALYEKQEGSMEVVLLPDGKAGFEPSLTASH